MIWMFENRNCSHVMLVALALAVVCISAAPAAWAKKAQRHPGNYLVPPPPAYMPSILPELRYGNQPASNSNNPYKKYVYSANGYEDPVPVKTHKTVTYWQPETSPVKTP